VFPYFFHNGADSSHSSRYSVVFESPSHAILANKTKEQLVERFNRNIGERISDVYDGKVYKHYAEHHGLSDWWNISLALFCDGAPIFESSKQSMWPYMFCILEFDSEIRYTFSFLKLMQQIFT
jgi:hypothetical protein